MNIDFPFFLLCATCATGLVAAIDKYLIAPKRDQALAAEGIIPADRNEQERLIPLIARESRSLFPVFILVLLLRSFIIQPFKVPTGSLEPTIMPGDFIAVTMFDYGLRLPVFNKTVLKVGDPKRGDILLFRWPVNPRIDFVKRVVGVPGDHISYINKVFYINGVEAKQQPLDATPQPIPTGAALPASTTRIMQEDLGGVIHKIALRDDVPAKDFYDLVVPADRYLMIGDNRDNSDDGRYWGFMQTSDIIGKGRMVLLNWDSTTHTFDRHRIGHKLSSIT